MIVILFVSICITHILKYPRSLEGAKNMNDEEDEEEKENMENEEEEEKENMENDEENEEKENMENKKNTEEMTNEMKEFMEVQNKIIGGMAELEPLMQKAEGFIEKFEKYSKY
jgi:flagellar biosynthesis/type III secretory pathway M-ring protein FliF/YscJ